MDCRLLVHHDFRCTAQQRAAALRTVMLLMRYFDTTFLAPLVREEKTSSRIARFNSWITGRRIGD
jgi:hypothetical protein